VLGDYKEFDGVKLPFRRTNYVRRGKDGEYVQNADFVVTEVKKLDQISDDLFSVPKAKKND